MRPSLLICLLALVAPRVGLADVGQFSITSVSGKHGELVTKTTFLYIADDCFGARREYFDNTRRSHLPKTVWDLYYKQELVGSIDPQRKAHLSQPLADGMVLKQNQLHLLLCKDGKVLRGWELTKAGLVLLPQAGLSDDPALKPIEYQPPSPLQASKMTRPFQPRRLAPARQP